MSTAIFCCCRSLAWCQSQMAKVTTRRKRCTITNWWWWEYVWPHVTRSWTHGFTSCCDERCSERSISSQLARMIWEASLSGAGRSAHYTLRAQRKKTPSNRSKRENEKKRVDTEDSIWTERVLLHLLSRQMMEEYTKTFVYRVQSKDWQRCFICNCSDKSLWINIHGHSKCANTLVSYCFLTTITLNNFDVMNIQYASLRVHTLWFTVSKRAFQGHTASNSITV